MDHKSSYSHTLINLAPFVRIARMTIIYLLSKMKSAFNSVVPISAQISCSTGAIFIPIHPSIHPCSHNNKRVSKSRQKCREKPSIYRIRGERGRKTQKMLLMREKIWILFTLTQINDFSLFNTNLVCVALRPNPTNDRLHHHSNHHHHHRPPPHFISICPELIHRSVTLCKFSIRHQATKERNGKGFP